MKSTANKKEATDGKLEKKLNGLKLLPGHDHVQQQFSSFFKKLKSAVIASTKFQK